MIVYVGPGHITGIPARDLTDDDIAELMAIYDMSRDDLLEMLTLHDLYATLVALDEAAEATEEEALTEDEEG